MRWLLLQGWSFGPDFWTALRREISVRFPGVEHDFTMGGLPYEKGQAVSAGVDWNSGCREEHSSEKKGAMSLYGKETAAIEASLVFHSVDRNAVHFETEDPQSVLVGRTFDIALGHSLGFCHLLWLCRQGMDLKKVVSVHGFTTFAQRDFFPCGVPLRVLKRMEKALSNDPSSVVHRFHCNAGMTQDQSRDYLSNRSYDPVVLIAGLRLLASVDYREIWRDLTLDKAFNSLVLANKNDAVVPEVLTEACFGKEAPLWLKTGDDRGGHLITPLTAKKIVAAIRKAF